MALDAQVNEIALLKEYANRLDDFREAILFGCGGLQQKAESILESIQNESQNVDYHLLQSQNLASATIRRYEEIVRRYNLSSTSITMLGNTADESKEILNKIEGNAAEIKEKIGKIRYLIEALQARTIAYATTIRDLSENGSEQLKKRSAILEQYKEQQI